MEKGQKFVLDEEALPPMKVCPMCGGKGEVPLDSPKEGDGSSRPPDREPHGN